MKKSQFQPRPKVVSCKDHIPTQKISNRIQGNYIPSAEASRQPRLKAYSSHAQNPNSEAVNFYNKKSTSNLRLQVGNNYAFTREKGHSSVHVQKGPVSSKLGSPVTPGVKTFEFEKQGVKRKGDLYSDWNEFQAQGNWMYAHTKDQSPMMRYQIPSEKAFQQKDQSLTPSSKYSQQRARDFTSQIQTIPGPKVQQSRPLEERSVTPERPIHPINKYIQQSTYFKSSMQSPKNENTNYNHNHKQQQFVYQANQKQDPQPQNANISKNSIIAGYITPGSYQINQKENIQQNYKSYVKKIQNTQVKANRYQIKDFLYRTPTDFFNCQEKK